MKIKTIFLLLRPRHYIKNLLLLAPAIFGGVMQEALVIQNLFIAFLSFSFAASFSYILNDIVDLERDKLHPTKKTRPLPAGEIRLSFAIIVAVVVLFLSILLAMRLPALFLRIVVIYVFLNLLYSVIAKRIVLLDIFTIAFFYVLRVYAGGAAVSVIISEWLFMTTFMLALLLAVSKRRNELLYLGENAQEHRAILGEYPALLLDGILWVTASLSIVTYALYTVERGNGLVYSVPIAVFVVFRYILIAFKNREGDPTRLFIRDLPLLVSVVFGTVIVLIALYR